MKDVGDGEVVGEGGPDQREGSGRDGEEAGDAGAACGLGKALGRDAGAPVDGQLTQGECAGQQGVGTEGEREKKGEATKYRHGGLRRLSQSATRCANLEPIQRESQVIR